MKIFANISIDAHEKERAFGKIDIDEIIDKSKIGNTVSQTAQELKFFQNAMDFSNIKLRECIIPRNDIKAISINTDIAELREKFIETGHSNIFVYSSNVDEIIGYINVKDIFKNPKDLKSIMRKALIVPETMSAKKLFEHLIKHNTSLAVVVDEFGSTSGMVTVEDIMEEIFGEFEDEHDTPEFNVQITAEGNYIISGRFEVDVFNEEYGFDLSESDEYETLAGYIMFHSGSFPKEGEIISISDDNKTYKFKMLKVHETKIERILLYDK
jgi:CBS domain containing-hemolysin-like protein